MPPEEEGPEHTANKKALEHQRSTTFLSTADSAIMVEDDGRFVGATIPDSNGNSDGNATAATGLTSVAGGFHLRWTRIEKQVEVKPEVHGLLAAAKQTTRRSMGLRKQHRRGDNSTDASESTRSMAQSTNSNSAFHVKTILHQVSGQAVPGQVLATMGPSGSGKTSLMNVLSGRAAYQEGTISVNGHPLSKSNLKRLMKKIAYVKQADIFFGHLTVRDQFTYTARLRLNESPEVIRQEVERLLRLLRLQKVGDSPIMMLSGGEKKRVNIGTSFFA
jgi:ABC-type multidrug transport system fused ATPase/permease subunit